MGGVGANDQNARDGAVAGSAAAARVPAIVEETIMMSHATVRVAKLCDCSIGTGRDLPHLSRGFQRGCRAPCAYAPETGSGIDRNYIGYCEGLRFSSQAR